MQQLLWFETVLKLSGGLALALAPLTIIALLGLPAASRGFWPRVVGAMLVGIAAATYIEGALPGSRGLGLAGCVIVNLISAGMIAALVTLRSAAETRRGTAVLWLLVVLLIVLSLFEIAHA
ncbi:MAG: ABC transporter permease [Hyphomicrobium sp.]